MFPRRPRYEQLMAPPPPMMAGPIEPQLQPPPMPPPDPLAPPPMEGPPDIIQRAGLQVGDPPPILPTRGPNRYREQMQQVLDEYSQAQENIPKWRQILGGVVDMTRPGRAAGLGDEIRGVGKQKRAMQQLPELERMSRMEDRDRDAEDWRILAEREEKRRQEEEYRRRADDFRREKKEGRDQQQFDLSIEKDRRALEAMGVPQSRLWQMSGQIIETKQNPETGEWDVAVKYEQKKADPQLKPVQRRANGRLYVDWVDPSTGNKVKTVDHGPDTGRPRSAAGPTFKQTDDEKTDAQTVALLRTYGNSKAAFEALDSRAAGEEYLQNQAKIRARLKAVTPAARLTDQGGDGLDEEVQKYLGGQGGEQPPAEPESPGILSRAGAALRGMIPGGKRQIQEDAATGLPKLGPTQGGAQSIEADPRTGLPRLSAPKPQESPQFQVGDIVEENGQRKRVVGIDPGTGWPITEPI